MKRKLALSLCFLVTAALFMGTALAISFELPSFDDMFVQHRVFLTMKDDSMVEVTTVFYRKSDNALVQINDETIFDKAAGVTLADLQAIDVDSIYPGTGSMSCAQVDFADNGDSVAIIISYSKLDDAENIRQMVDNGFLTLEGTGSYVDAGSICDGYIRQGYPELQITDYADLPLHFDVK